MNRSTEPIDRQTLAERTYRRLREEIECGELPQGLRLDEQALCDRLGVSRTPLRHALEQLANDRLVRRIPYRGTFVRSFDAAEVENLYVVRSVLEQLAARLAVERATTDEMAEIRELATECQAAVERDDVAALNAADQLFHEAVIDASRNDVLIRLLSGLRRQVHAVRSFANENVQLAKQTINERLVICDALEARDANETARLLSAHIDGVRDAVLCEMRAESTTTENELRQEDTC
jgi:DNA-binding GntR family transcriptional regulator